MARCAAIAGQASIALALSRHRWALSALYSDGCATMTAGICSAEARWDDEVALGTLFAPIPRSIIVNIQAGRAAHPSRFAGMRHDAATDRAFYVISDDTYVQVWTLTPCSESEAARIWAVIDRTAQVTVTTMVKAYKDVTGRTVEYVQ